MAGMIEWTIRHRVFSFFIVDGLALPGAFYRDLYVGISHTHGFMNFTKSLRKANWLVVATQSAEGNRYKRSVEGFTVPRSSSAT